MRNAAYEFLLFGLKEARACVFAGLTARRVQLHPHGAQAVGNRGKTVLVDLSLEHLQPLLVTALVGIHFHRAIQ